MANRCKNTTNLEYHHINRYGKGILSNCEMLCEECHANTQSNGTPRDPNKPKREPFPQTVKDEALIDAENQCECTRENCH